MRQRLAFLAVLLAVLAVPAAAPAAVTPAIIGGADASTTDFPFMAAVVDATATSDTDGVFCGGTLVAPMLVMTAAHCTYGLDGAALAPSGIVIVLGRTDLRAVATGERIAVTGIEREPGYRESTLLHDVALLQLARPAVEAPAALVGPGDALLWAPAVPATVIGWGNTVAGSGQAVYPPVLQGVTVPVLADGACSAPGAYGTDYLPETMLCAGVLAGGKDSCDGDSGGPLLVQAVDGWRVAGITSWGAKVCAEKNRPGVYTRVAAERAWIDSLRAPRAPLLRATDRRDGTLRLTWTPRPGALPTDSYAITIQPGSHTVTAPGTATTIDVPGLPHDRVLTVSITATNATLGTSGTRTTTARIYGLPSIVARPVLRGARVGGTARCTAGTWRGLLPMTIAYRWLVDGRVVGRRDGLRITSAVGGHRLACEVVATSPDGRSSARSLVTRARRAHR